jgi:hypothetical protein
MFLLAIQSVNSSGRDHKTSSLRYEFNEGVIKGICCKLPKVMPAPVENKILVGKMALKAKKITDPSIEAGKGGKTSLVPSNGTCKYKTSAISPNFCYLNTTLWCRPCMRKCKVIRRGLLLGGSMWKSHLCRVYSRAVQINTPSASPKSAVFAENPPLQRIL